MIPGIQATMGGLGGTAVSLQFLEHWSSTTDLTTYTFSAKSLGVESPDRLIAVAIATEGSAADRTVSSVTVNGVSASSLAAITGGTGSNTTVAIWQAAVPTGTSGDYVVVMSGACLRMAIMNYRITGANSTPTDTGTNDGLTADPTLTQDVVARGAAMAVAYSLGDTTTTWVGLTEVRDVQFETSTYTTAADEFAAAQTGMTVTANFATPDDALMAVVSWGPA